SILGWAGAPCAGRNKEGILPFGTPAIPSTCGPSSTSWPCTWVRSGSPAISALSTTICWKADVPHGSGKGIPLPIRRRWKTCRVPECGCALSVLGGCGRAPLPPDSLHQLDRADRLCPHRERFRSEACSSVEESHEAAWRRLALNEGVALDFINGKAAFDPSVRPQAKEAIYAGKAVTVLQGSGGEDIAVALSHRMLTHGILGDRRGQGRGVIGDRSDARRRAAIKRPVELDEAFPGVAIGGCKPAAHEGGLGGDREVFPEAGAQILDVVG